MQEIELREEIKKKLELDGVSREIIDALGVAMKNSTVNPYAYASGMDRSFVEYGSYGIYTNMIYMMINMHGWKGEEARETKKILKKWKWKN